MRFGNLKAPTKFSVGIVSCGMECAKRLYRCLWNPCPSVTLPSWSVRAVIEIIATPLRYTVMDVISRSAFKQMLRSHAWRIIAVMQHPVCRPDAIREKPDQVRGSNVTLPRPRGSAIAAPVRSPKPEPAFPCHVDARPETLGGPVIGFDTVLFPATHFSAQFTGTGISVWSALDNPKLTNVFEEAAHRTTLGWHTDSPRYRVASIESVRQPGSRNLAVLRVMRPQLAAHASIAQELGVV